MHDAFRVGLTRDFLREDGTIDPIFSLPNVIATPHSLAWTDELALGHSRSACESVLDVAAGRTPKDVVNKEVLENALLQETLSGYGEREGPEAGWDQA